MDLLKNYNFQKMQNQGVWTELEMKICFFRQSWTKSCKQIHEIKQKQVFVCNVLQLIFYEFLLKTLKFGFRVSG